MARINGFESGKYDHRAFLAAQTDDELVKRIAYFTDRIERDLDHRDMWAKNAAEWDKVRQTADTRGDKNQATRRKNKAELKAATYQQSIDAAIDEIDYCTLIIKSR